MQAIKNFSPALVVKSRRRCVSAALLGRRARTKVLNIEVPGPPFRAPGHPRRVLPFSPRKGKRKGKLPKRGRRGQETRLPPDVWLEVWFQSALRPRTASGILVAPGRPWLHLRGRSGTTTRLPPAWGSPAGNPEGREEAFGDPQMNLRSVYWFLLEGAKRLRMHLRILKRTSTEPQRRMHGNI